MKEKKLAVPETVIVGLLVFILTIANAFSPLDYIARDYLYQMPRGINSSIKIIGIDEKTINKYGQIQTWSRSMYADLLDKLNADGNGPAIIGFDIVFAGEIDEGDAAFADAVKKYGNVVVVDQLLYSKKAESLPNGVLYYPVEGVLEPYPALLDAAKEGYSNVSQDSDGTVRRVIPEEHYNGQTYKMFSRVMYEEYAALKGITVTDIPTDNTGRTLINYSGEPGDYECVSMADVLEGNIDPRAFTGSVVFVGAYAPGMQDNFVVPNGWTEQMYGVEIHANIFQSYLENLFAIDGNHYLYGIIMAVLAMILHLCFRKLKVWQSVILLVASIALVVTADVILNSNGISFYIIYFPIVAILSFVYVLSLHYLVEQAKKRKVLNAFKKYVAPQIVDEIAKKGDFEIKLGGQNKDISVLFVDIRGFTTMSEALEPEQVV